MPNAAALKVLVVDDSPEVDHEIFESGEFEAEEWVLISEEAPLDEPKRDELVERFQLSHGAGGELPPEDDTLDDDEEDDVGLGQIMLGMTRKHPPRP